MDLIEEIVSREECIERELRIAPINNTEIMSPLKTVLKDIEIRIDHIERKIKENALREKRCQTLPMNITDEFIRIDRIEMKMRDTLAETNGPTRSALPARMKQNS
ncbi:unnamed protein product [Cylicostephanus goldi]|uniref:Uncharacterized protein n=1 Tax=Cylicostephanus goldi TaxID=71465 RepID=A0A3P6RIH3_CYLGO|nr:unnamed protein product [Cylicostephanus goldi]